MALTIEGASQGYDRGGVEVLMQRIHSEVINEAKNSMQNNLSNLNTAIDDIWQGQSATNFKNNMALDVQSIKDALDATYEVLNTEIHQVANAMAQVDQELVKARS